MSKIFIKQNMTVMMDKEDQDEHKLHAAEKQTQLPDTGENIETENLQHGIQINFDPSDNSDSSTTCTHLKTKHAACVSKILGMTGRVVKFDELHHQLKSGKKPRVKDRHIINCSLSFNP